MKKITGLSFLNHKDAPFSNKGIAAFFYGVMLILFLFGATVLHAQTPQILKDINGLVTNNSQAATGYNFKGYNGYVYFSAEDGFNGFELWKSNGTEVGTVMVKDINTGTLSSSPGSFVEMNGILFFIATNNSSGIELWKTDGTAAGTVIVKDINAGVGSSSPQNLLVINGVLYFTATTSANGRELWKSDGTDPGTVLIKDIIAGSTNSTPQNLVNYRDTLYFTASFTGIGRELWKSDGTTAGTVLVKDIYPGAPDSGPLDLTVSGNFLFFTADDGVSGTELWTTDGSEAGTILLKDIRPGISASYPSELSAVNNLLVFRAYDGGSSGEELWVSDGTGAGTFLLKDIYPGSADGYPNFLTVVGNTIFFGATDPVNDSELWQTDGTSAGTVMVKDIAPGLDGSNPDRLININGILFFTAYTNTDGVELWKSDGTTAGTIMVKDINPGLPSSSPNRMTNVNGILYFTASQGTTVLMKSDGTESGTVALNTSVVSNGSFNTFYGFENKLYFMYNGYKPGIPVTATGIETWVSDGTNAGTTLIKDINPTTNTADPGPYGKAGNTIFFAANDGTNGTELWKTDGTAAGTVLLKDIYVGTGSSTPTNFTNVNGTMFFLATVSASGTELWKTDGTTAGTLLVKDIRPGAAASGASALTASGNLLYLIANDGTAGPELWKSDGTTAGTVLVADIVAGNGTPNLTLLTDLNGTLFFTALVAASGRELWKSDGTAAGTVMVKDIVVGSGSPAIANLVAYNGKVFFNANDGVNGNEPWVSDGTNAGTTLFINIAPNGSFPNSNPTNFTVAGGKLYFTAFTATTSFEPWVSDGTVPGTYMIIDLVPGGSGSSPVGFTFMDGYVYFNAGGTGIGRELWRTDNTAVGTTLVKDINTGSASGSPELITLVNSTLFFRATMPAGGVEFYKSDGTTAGTVGYDLYPGTTASTPDYLTALNNKLVFSATHQVLGREIWKIDVIPASNFTVVGDTLPCVGGTATYSALNVLDNTVTYNWSLPLGGGTITNADTTATVTWTTAGARTVQLVLSNAAGSSAPRSRNLVVSGTPPADAPVIYNFARLLSTGVRPIGTSVQWFRNNTLIAGATDSFYYAGLAGSYTLKYMNDCGPGPASNMFSFPADTLAQTITFPHTPDQIMAPALKIKLPATASSNLPVFYTRLSGPGTVSQDSLAITGVGSIIIKAMQPGDDIYSAAVTKYDTIIVIKGNQLINFPTIPAKMFRNTNFTISASSSVGLPVLFSIISGNATVSGTTVHLTGAGNVTVRASQAGNTNYNAAPPNDQIFCVGIDTLSAIAGAGTACLGTYTYTVQKIPGANYVWTLSGGGTMTTNNDTAFVSWQTGGTHTLKVKANSSCNAVYSFEPQKSIIINNVTPTPVSYMSPANNAVNQSLPLILSWVPGQYTETYDLFVWDSAAAQPGTPYKSNITGISYTIPQSAFAYNTTYKWRLVSKNPCNQVSGPIQHFRLVPLPDVTVTSVVAPTTAISGQSITISWTVKNNGPGNTPTGDSWQDAVYLTFDTFPNFSIAPEVSPVAWAPVNFPVRALLLGTRTNVAALQSGQQYTNSINFNIPISYSLPLYAYVITNIGNYGIVEVTKVNDTARAPNPIDISLAPTPDLRVESMFTPSSTFSGSAVNVSYTVKNYGTLTPAGANWEDNVYISQSLLFDSASAIKLNAPKANASYYPNAFPAGATVNTQLQNDSMYNRSFQVVIPNYIFGTWFIHVKTNNKGTLYEGSLFNNNTNNNPIQVYLTPTPKLTINSLTLPVTQASITQPIGVNWNIYNNGFRDNIEKNRGHYITNGTCYVPCGPGSPPNSVCTTISVAADSIVFGSSYWLDRVYLSTDSTGLNLANATLLKETKHGTQNSGLYADPYPSFVSCPALAYGNVNLANVIHPGSDFPTTASFNLPSNLQQGTYYIYVWTNVTKTVFEYPGTPEIKRTGALIIQRPDATVSAINSPANAIAGQQIEIGYDINNNGPGAVYNHIRRDSIYVSSSPVFNSSAVVFATNTFTEDLPVGAPVHHTANYTLPPSQSGTRYFYVRTNIDSAFRETNANNNLSTAAATIFAAATPLDLIVASVQTADTVVTVFQSVIDYTVSNVGTITASGTWTDSVFISCNAVFNPSTAFYIGKKTKSRSIAAGASLADTVHVKIPFTYYINSCFANYYFNNAYFFVKTNANNGVYEGANTTNNTTGSSVKVVDNPVVDHIVTSVTGADSAVVGHTYNLSWVVKNIGRNPGFDYDTRKDSIYISVDSVLNGNAIGVSRRAWNDRLQHDQLKTLTSSFSFANVPSGYYYVFVKTNATNEIQAEKNRTNNTNLIRDINNAAKKIWITRPLLPDLTDSILSAPTSIAIGQPITIVHRIKNIGSAPTYPNYFQHRIRFANDAAGNGNYATLSIKSFNTILQPGQYIDDTVNTIIPQSVAPRIYSLYSKADDVYDRIPETNENNNAGVRFIDVYRLDPTDLTVLNVSAPDTVLLGYKMDSARWVIKNSSGMTATGQSSDGIYLSQSNVLDSSAVLIGIKTRQLNMAPLASNSLVHAPLVTGVTEGNYNMFISADLTDQIPETDEDNNIGISVAQVYVKVKALLLNITETNTLHTDNRFYKLVIPDSLNGATISVKLTTGDSLTRINQMFIGKGYVPTAAHFDYTYPTANYGNQEIVMAYTTAGTYYIMIRTINPGSVIQNISLLAKKLPFAITNVHTNSGGNIGNVTVKISGSLFAAGMTAKLTRPGTTIIASTVYFTNTTIVYATFNLQGKPLGIYDVILSKADTAIATLVNGFSVVPANNGGVITGGGNNSGSGNGNAPGCDPGAASGWNSQLIAELLVPEFVMRGWPFVIQLNYSNPSNFDIPAQVRTLYAEQIIKMALTPQGVNNGVQTLTLQLTEQDGPPGIIRAGGSGTIFIYAKSDSNVPAHTITLFRLQ
ncbi:MAG: ELWxxDGT repeat protein [Ferruginibacter sp.]